MCDVLLDFVPFAQFKKCEKFPWKSEACNFTKKRSSMGSFYVFWIVKMVPNYAKRHITIQS